MGAPRSTFQPMAGMVAVMVVALAAFARADPTAPHAPAAVDVTSRSPSQLEVRWTAPASDGGSEITSYLVERVNHTSITHSTNRSGSL